MKKLGERKIEKDEDMQNEKIKENEEKWKTKPQTRICAFSSKRVLFLNGFIKAIK